MSGGQSIWDKLSRLALAFLVLAALMSVVLWYEPVVRKNQHLREQKLALEQKIEKETETGHKLDAALRAMQDPITVERLARERLSYARPGEDVVRFEAPIAR